VRKALAAIDPELPLYDVHTMAERVETSLQRRRTPMLLAVAFGAVALLLAAVGIYGVLAYQVTQRTREIGIRLALGSSAGGVFQLVLREAFIIVGIGLTIGLTGGIGLRQALESQLYGVSATDPAVLGSVGVVLGTVALIASAVPARRATRIDPVIALSRE